jgi:hypothetical protein
MLSSALSRVILSVQGQYLYLLTRFCCVLKQLVEVGKEIHAETQNLVSF